MVLSCAISARAQDPFEIQVYDAQVADYGTSMEELHVILKPAVTNPPPSVVARDPGLLHITSEPQVGLGHHLETAFYIETALWPDGSYHVAGAKLRGKWKLWFADHWPVQLAVNGEVGNVDTNSDTYAWNAEIRPIAEAHAGPCRFFVNPNVGIPLGHDLHAGPDFEPQAKANCSVIYDIAPGLEYYTDLGPLLDWAPLRKQQQTLFYTIDVYHWSKVELGLGVGEPLTRFSGPWILNTNLGLQLP